MTTPIRELHGNAMKGYDAMTTPTPVHVYPLGDLREHELSVKCWCAPTEEESGEIVVHHSMDGREEFERPYGRRKAS